MPRARTHQAYNTPSFGAAPRRSVSPARDGQAKADRLPVAIIGHPMFQRFLALLASAAFVLAGHSACSSRPAAGKFPQKLLILGFDGMDPDLVTKWMDEGKLPNIQRVAREGGIYPLATTHSPESPTAWAS